MNIDDIFWMQVVLDSIFIGYTSSSHFFAIVVGGADAEAQGAERSATSLCGCSSAPGSYTWWMPGRWGQGSPHGGMVMTNITIWL